MKTIKTILTLFIGVAIGATTCHFFSQSQPTTKPTDGPKLSHSTSDPQRTAMEADFANQYLKFHAARDIGGLMAMGKFEGVFENIVSSKKGWMDRSLAQQIIGISFRELNVWEIRKRADLSLEPLLVCTIRFAQNDPDDVMQSTSHTLGVDGGHLYMTAERARK